jgi:hypothetical protein
VRARRAEQEMHAVFREALVLEVEERLGDRLQAAGQRVARGADAHAEAEALVEDVLGGRPADGPVDRPRGG